MLMHYELISVVIQKCLGKIVDKMKKDIQLTDGDQVTIYEISLTFFTIVMQTNNFVFSDLDLIKQHKINEFLIQHEKLVSEGKIPHSKKTPKPPANFLVEDQSKMTLKCKRDP